MKQSLCCSKKIIPVALLILVLLIAVGAYFAFFAHRAVASIVLQVNPEIALTVDERNVVIGFGTEEGVLVGLDLVNRDKSEALRMIADALRGAGLLGEERRILIAINPIGDRMREAELAVLNSAVDQTIRGYLAEHNLALEVKSVVVTAELASAILAADLSPADYVDLVVEVGESTVLALFGLQEGLGIDPVLFKEEFSTMASALADMKEAGVAESDALAILRGALIADRSLEELTTITAAMIDLHEVGAGSRDIMAVFDLIEAQLAAGMDRTRLLEEFTTITAAKADMLEAGVPAEAALAALGTAFAADPKLEELTTITAAMIDLHEAGLSQEEALARIQSAIQADPTLQRFDDLIEEAVKGEEENEVRAPARPQQPSPRPGMPEDETPDEVNAIPQGSPADAPGAEQENRY